MSTGVTQSLLASAGTSEHPVDVGQRTEAVILDELVKRGYRVLLPFGVNHRYDLVLDLDGRFLRVQCKTGRVRRGCVQFNARSIRSTTKRVHTRTYAGEIDLFAVYCPANGRVYAVPIDDATLSDCSLRLVPTRNGQAEGVRWAADYELPA
jgi:hypothetical protein